MNKKKEKTVIHNSLDNESSENLAARIVVFRKLGINKDDSKKAMIILHKRKLQGDDFDYNSYIESKISEFDAVEKKVDISTVKNMLVNMEIGE